MMKNALLKIPKYLEEYAQWGILALGVAFFGYMMWTYVYQNPAARQYDGVPAGPGNIDKAISDGPGTILEQKLHQTQSPLRIDVPAIPPLDLAAPTTQPVAVTPLAWDSWPVDVDKIVGKLDINSGQAIAGLPTPPPALYVDEETLRTVITATDANGQPARKDQDAVTTFWEVPVGDLAKAFRAALAGLPPAKQATTILRTQLIRQEKLADGSWGSEQIIPLPFDMTQPPPPYPANGAPTDAYIAWINQATNQQWFLAPTFPTIADTTRPDLQWYPLETWLPYRAQVQAIEALPVTNIATPAPTPQVNIPPPVSQFGGGFRGGGGGAGARLAPGGGDFGGGAPAPVNPFAQSPTPAQATPDQQAALVVPQVNVPKFQPPPAGQFSPAALIGQGDFEIYIHDFTVEPGKTYRYKLRYTLLNPVYGAAGQNAALAAVFGIDSQDSAWSDTIVNPAKTRFWCATRQPVNNQGQVAFAVFTWHDGLWQQKNYASGGGDEIGADEGDKGDYVTHWTMLDVKLARTGSVDRNVLLTPDNGGPAELRNIAGDTQTQDYKHFMRDFLALTQPAGGAPVAPTTPAAPVIRITPRGNSGGLSARYQRN